MSVAIEHYQRMADKARLEAKAALLPIVREMHLQSAERLDSIVFGLERVAQAKLCNEDAKREAAG